MREIMFVKKYWNIWLFLLFAICVTVAELVVLQPIIKYVLINPTDDWVWLGYYKQLSHLSFIPRFAYMWTKIGIGESGYAIYMWFVGDVFGTNYLAYNYVSVGLKIMSALTFFPLLLIIFKNKFLAFLTSFLYGINSATTGPMYWIMKAGSFAGVALMNLFLICYYFTITRKSKIWLLLATILIFLSYLISAVRIYPIFFVIVLIEIFWHINFHPKKGLKSSIVRVVLFLLPSILVALTAPLAPQGNIKSEPFILLNEIRNGNLHHLLPPLEGMGYSFLTNYYWKFFGTLGPGTFTQITNYIGYLIHGPLLVFAVATLVFSFLIPKKPKSFFILVFCFNFILEIGMFYIATFHFSIPQNLRFQYDPGLFYISKYPQLVGIYVLVVAFASFLEWRKDKHNRLLLALWVGPIFSFIFLELMWVFIGWTLMWYDSTGYYWFIPAMGMSLFVCTILVLIYQKLKKNLLFRILSILIVIGVIAQLYKTSSFDISTYFIGVNPEKVTVSAQEIMHDKLMNVLGNAGKNGDLLIYFEFPSDKTEANYYKRILGIENGNPVLQYMIVWRRDDKGIGCVGYISDVKTLKLSFQYKNGKSQFIANSRCVLKSPTSSVNIYSGKERWVFSADNLYAYKIDNGNFIDIKESVLKKLRLGEI